MRRLGLCVALEYPVPGSLSTVQAWHHLGQSYLSEDTQKVGDEQVYRTVVNCCLWFPHFESGWWLFFNCCRFYWRLDLTYPDNLVAAGNDVDLLTVVVKKWSQQGASNAKDGNCCIAAYSYLPIWSGISPVCHHWDCLSRLQLCL